MNEFTVADRIKWFAVTAGVAVAAVPLSFVLWKTPPGVAAPPPSLLPFFIPIGVVIPAVAFGFGVAFLLFGGKLLRVDGTPGMSRAAFLSIGWLLLNWWPHSNFHRVANGWANVVVIDYVFHATVIAATYVVAIFFLRLIRERQTARQVGTGAHDLASTTSA